MTYLTTDVKKEVFQKASLQSTSKDTGSVEAQVSLFTFRINEINNHLSTNKKDSSSRLGLLKLVGKRRRLLNYLQSKDINRYRQLIAKLELRK
jgi:small subunit ribosomal protein S15